MKKIKEQIKWLEDQIEYHEKRRDLNNEFDYHNNSYNIYVGLKDSMEKLLTIMEVIKR